jgi:hypothetical protein
MPNVDPPDRLAPGDPRRAFWERFFWQALEGPTKPKEMARTILAATDLHALVGDEAYAALVISAVDGSAAPAIDRTLFETVFPRRCYCRRRSPMNEDVLDFSGRNVCRRLYYVDDCVGRSTTLLFRRTPDIDLLRCAECGDVWLRGMDQDWLRQYLVLLEPGDLDRIIDAGLWPEGLDRAEDSWTRAFGGLHRGDPNLPAWQAQANTAEAFRRYGLKRSATSP